MIPAPVHIASKLRRKHFITSACSIIVAILLLSPQWGPGGLSAQGVYQSDPAFGRQFNRVRAGIILTPPYFADSSKLPTLPIRYAGALRIDSTIGSLAYTYTDSTLWTYSGTQWHRMPRTTSPSTLSWSLDTTGQAQGRPLFSGPGNTITSAAWWLIDTANRKIVINNTNVSIGGPSYRLYVNGKAHIETLTIAGNTTLGKPPTGASTTYPVAWNPTTQEILQYEQWPDSIVSYGKNATGDSTILLLSNGRRFAAKDSTGGGGGGGITGIGTFSASGNANGASISGTDLILHPATATEPGAVSIGAQTFAGVKTFNEPINTDEPTTNTGIPSIYFRNAGTASRMGIGRNGSQGTMQFFTYGTGSQGFRWYGGGDFNDGATNWMSLASTGLTLGVDLNLSSVLRTSGAASNTAQASIYLRDFTGAGNQIGIGRGIADVQFFGINDYGFRWYGGGQFNNGAANWLYLDQNGLAVGGGTNAGSAILTATSTTKGFLPPRMTTTQRNAISSPAAGLIIFCTDCTATDGSTGVSQTYSSGSWRNHY